MKGVHRVAFILMLTFDLTMPMKYTGDIARQLISKAKHSERGFVKPNMLPFAVSELVYLLGSGKF